MSGFREFRWVAVAAAVLVLAGCTVRVDGEAQPVPGQGPVKPVVDACSLLDQQQVTALGYREPGKPEKANPQRLTPASCSWNSADDNATLAILSVGWAVDLSQDEYLQGALPKSQPQSVGGFTWTQYTSVLAGNCDLYTTLGPKSFVYVSVNYPDETKACELAKPVIPQVAAHLPGGLAAPSITPTNTAPPTPAGPLLNLDPCTLLTSGEAASLKMTAPGTKQESTAAPGTVFCLWNDTDGDRGQKPFEVWLGPATPMTQWPGMNVPPTSTLDVGTRHWSIFPNFNESGVNCAAGLTVTPTSSIQIVSGFLDDTSKSCDAVKAGIPLVSAHLPS
ncbi:MAG TPA: DUF3558 family protein [Amycolatopsis sp.]|nr:DUF3558 family protein [Amycolatopsis sp.]